VLRKLRIMYSEQGSIMLMALMIFLILSVLGTALIGMARMELQTSDYAIKVQQARQAADAGVEWAMRKIYVDILKDRHDNNPPPPPSFSGETWPKIIGEGSGQPEFTISDYDSQPKNDPINHTYSYKFTSIGTYKGASMTVDVTVAYSYWDTYEGEVFKSREYRDGPENIGITLYTEN